MNIKKGDIYPTNYCGDVKVLHVFSHKDIHVEFLITGNKKRVSQVLLLSGKAKCNATMHEVMRRVKLMSENNDYTPSSPKALYLFWLNRKERNDD